MTKTKLSREEKTRIKEHNKQVEALNKQLVTVSNLTNKSLGLISFAPDGTMRFVNNKWKKVYRITDNSVIDKIIDRSTLRAKITVISENENITYYVTFIANGEVYSDIKELIEDNVTNVTEGTPSLSELSLEEVISVVSNLFNIEETISISTSIRKKEDWKKMVYSPIYQDLDNEYKMKNEIVMPYIVNQFPDSLDSKILKNITAYGVPFVGSVDVQSFTDDELVDLNRSLELKTNRKIDITDTDIANATCTLVLKVNSIEEKTIIENHIKEISSNYGISIVPTYGFEELVTQSIFSLGITDFHSMRNTKHNIIKNLMI